MPPKRTGTGSPSQNPTAKLLGLTESSSATEAGEDRLWTRRGRTASRCSLERVVRPAPTERMARTVDGDSGGGTTGAPAGQG